jgi:tetratricopeptide (TPR) repeat protein
MANIQLRETLFGGMTGTVSGNIELSWSDRERLDRAAAGAMASAVELRRVGRSLDDIAAAQAWMAHAVWRLEGELGLRLDQQTLILSRQRELLLDIAEALRTPAKTRAAERIADTGELLRRGRYDRALAVAQEAIGDDPNNPAGFRAAAWSLLGLARLEEAHRCFLECASAADGDERAEALRQAARLSYLLDSPEGALAVLANADDRMGDTAARAVRYDQAVYLAEAGNHAAATRELKAAYGGDERFAFQALNDQVLRRHAAVVAPVEEHVNGVIAALRSATEATQGDLDETDRIVALLVEEAEAQARRHRTVQGDLWPPIHELRARRTALAEPDPPSGEKEGAAVALKLPEVENRARHAHDLCRDAAQLLAAREERTAALAIAAQNEERERALAVQRNRLLDDAVAKTVAEAGRGARVERSVFDFRATVTVAGMLRGKSVWEITVDDTPEASVVRRR